MAADGRSGQKAHEMAIFRRVVETWPDAFPCDCTLPFQPVEPAADIGIAKPDGSIYAVEITELMDPVRKQNDRARQRLLQDLDLRLHKDFPDVSIGVNFVAGSAATAWQGRRDG